MGRSGERCRVEWPARGWIEDARLRISRHTRVGVGDAQIVVCGSCALLPFAGQRSGGTMWWWSLSKYLHERKDRWRISAVARAAASALIKLKQDPQGGTPNFQSLQYFNYFLD